MPLKRVVFIFLMYIPGVLLFTLIAFFLVHIDNIKTLDHELVKRDLIKHINRKRTVDNYEATEKDNGNDLIYFLGGSSLVLPDTCNGELARHTFPNYLEEKIKKHKFSIINLGQCGKDSGDILEIFKKRIINRRPKLVIFYGGHNDYVNSYLHFLLPKYYDFLNHKKVSEMLMFMNLHLMKIFKEHSLPWKVASFVRKKLEYRLYHMLENIGDEIFHKTRFVEYEDIILNGFKRNIQKIAALSKQNDIPLVLMSPISNLEIVPLGIGPFVRRDFFKSNQIKNYNKRVMEQRRIRDLDYFSSEIRAKKQVAIILENLAGRKQYFFDLEKKMIDRKNNFDKTIFSDSFHLNKNGHRLVANLLFEYLEEIKFVGN